MIAEVLSTSRKDCLSGRELAQLFHCSIRDITKQIETERRQGAPICATPVKNGGYYLAANDTEVTEYCARLSHRINELETTKRALLRHRRNTSNNIAK